MPLPGITLLALHFSFSAESRKSRHTLPDMRFKILRVRVGAVVEQTQAFRRALLIFYLRMQSQILGALAWHPFLSIFWPKLNYFTAETAESSETSGSKV